MSIEISCRLLKWTEFSNTGYIQDAKKPQHFFTLYHQAIVWVFHSSAVLLHQLIQKDGGNGPTKSWQPQRETLASRWPGANSAATNKYLRQEMSRQ